MRCQSIDTYGRYTDGQIDRAGPDSSLSSVTQISTQNEAAKKNDCETAKEQTAVAATATKTTTKTLTTTTAT